MSGTGKAGETEPRGLGEGSTQVVAATVIAVSGAVAGYFMPLAGYAFGLAAIVLSLLARRRGAVTRWLVPLVIGVGAIVMGVVMQMHYASLS
ncbi:hypothetical protein [Pseudonocardia sp. N23]|uniref:hypothetical protein n=1 Tax=Pseudonocardia sp. N23 TaxID=1987376 RepID=UPI000BFD9156|nr:hypothetical protein [Pseudonocardia sp. N23]GAY11592.1 hypothetical protein TOK_6102 [Pseudonocardia sp. N23]